MAHSPRFADRELAELERAKILGVRAGAAHRFTGVWVVVVDRRVFVRSWNDAPGGWYRAFRATPHGAIALAGGAELPVRARAVRSDAVRRAVTQAYAAKYHTRASEKWVQGFAEDRREATTLELVPA
jgi:hypothetical protein